MELQGVQKEFQNCEGISATFFITETQIGTLAQAFQGKPVSWQNSTFSDRNFDALRVKIFHELNILVHTCVRVLLVLAKYPRTILNSSNNNCLCMV